MKKNMKSFSYSLFKNVALLSSLEICVSCSSNNTVNKHNQDNVKAPTSSMNGNAANANNANLAEERVINSVVVLEDKKITPEEDSENEKVVKLDKIEGFSSTRAKKLKEYGRLKINDSENIYSSEDHFVFKIIPEYNKVELVRLDVEEDFAAENIKVPKKVRIEGKTYSVTRIGDNACENFENIKHVNLPSSISYIGERAFGSCNGLESVSFYENEEIVVSEGKNDSALENLKQGVSNFCSIFFSDFNDEEKLEQLQDAASKISKIKFENSKDTLEIGKLAFCNCKSLKEIEIPQGVKKIGDRAFLSCEKLSKISLKNVKEIGDNAFRFCNNLLEISLEGVKKIGDHAFIYCNNLSKISLKNVEEIGNLAFRDTGIEEVLIPASVTVLGEMAFYSSSIKKIILESESTLTNAMIKKACGKYQAIAIIRL